MRAVVAYRGDGDGAGALVLAGAVRRTTGAELSVVAVLPRVSSTGEDRSDLEYRQYLDSVVAEARASAATILSPDDPGALDFERVSATSVAAGLTGAVQDRAADVLILGCARDATQRKLVVGSVGDRLLHSSPVPVLLAPHGYTAAPEDGFRSLTCAYIGTHRSKEALALTCELAARHAMTVRVATFVPRAEAMHPPTVGLDAEEMVASQLAEQAVRLHDEAVELCREHGVDDVETVVGRGQGWAGALASVSWTDRDVLVFGSSRLGQLARVFLGSTASKIIRHTPVPVLVVPAGASAWTA